MSKSIRKDGQNKIDFVFEKGRLKGERYSETFEICPTHTADVEY